MLLGGASYPALAGQLARALPLELRRLGGGCGTAMTGGFGAGRGAGVDLLDLGTCAFAHTGIVEKLLELLRIHIGHSSLPVRGF